MRKALTFGMAFTCAVYAQSVFQPNQPPRFRPDALSTVWPYTTYTAAHLADGQGWTSDIILMSLGSTPQCFSVQIYGNTGAPLAVPLVSYGTQSSVRICLQPLGSATLKSTGASSPLIEGWVLLGCDPMLSFCFGGPGAPIAGSIVFRRSTPGQPDFEAAVPFDDNSVSHVALPFDNTNGFLTGLALTNPQKSQTVVTFVLHAEDGTQLFVTAFSLGPRQHMSFVLPTTYPQTAGTRGVLEITSTSGVGVLGLRFNPTGPFTTLFPVTNGLWQ